MEQLQKVETSLKINREAVAQLRLPSSCSLILWECFSMVSPSQYLGILFTSWSHLAVSLQIQRRHEDCKDSANTCMLPISCVVCISLYSIFMYILTPSPLLHQSIQLFAPSAPSANICKCCLHSNMNHNRRIKKKRKNKNHVSESLEILLGQASKEKTQNSNSGENQNNQEDKKFWAEINKLTHTNKNNLTTQTKQYPVVLVNAGPSQEPLKLCVFFLTYDIFFISFIEVYLFSVQNP